MGKIFVNPRFDFEEIEDKALFFMNYGARNDGVFKYWGKQAWFEQSAEKFYYENFDDLECDSRVKLREFFDEKRE
jgi:hypothetical protein